MLRNLPSLVGPDYIELELLRSETVETLQSFNDAVREFREQLLTLGLDMNFQGEKFRGAAPEAILGGLLPVAPLLGAAIGFVLRGWIDSRNGRRLKIRVGEIEVDATQLKEAEVVQIFDLLQERAEQSRIRRLLTDLNPTPQSEKR